MRAQMSIELLVYASLSGIALLYAAHLVAADAPNIDSAVYSYEASAFVQEVNNNIASGTLLSPFTVQVPNGLCGAEVVANRLYGQYGSYSFITNVTIPANALCIPGEQQMELAMSNGTMAIEVVQ